jgi:uncharacterized membrane protein YfcA
MQMDINQILGYITALFIGITLGIFGGGGSILTLPVLVYLIGTESTLGIVYSMLIVGVTTFVGAINAYLKKTLNLKAAYSFGIPSVIAVFLTRKFITPWIEEGVWMIGSYELLGKHLLMILFALLMIIVALFMIFKKNKEEELLKDNHKRFYFGIVLKALLVGFISGLIGAGGGFVIVPAMIAFYKLDAKKAIGTSMIIISGNSLVGFLGYFINYILNDLAKNSVELMPALGNYLKYNHSLSFYHVTVYYANMDWSFLSIFTFICTIGVILGAKIAQNINSKNLKRAFGFFVLGMGIFVFAYEFYLKK